MTDEQAMKALCQQKAAELWTTFNKSERTGVRFGMFPAAPMKEATDAGYDSRLLAVALMECK